MPCDSWGLLHRNYRSKGATLHGHSQNILSQIFLAMPTCDFSASIASASFHSLIDSNSCVKEISSIGITFDFNMILKMMYNTIIVSLSVPMIYLWVSYQQKLQCSGSKSRSSMHWNFQGRKHQSRRRKRRGIPSGEWSKLCMAGRDSCMGVLE